MTPIPTEVRKSARYFVRRDLRTVRTVLRQIKRSAQLLPFSLFGRRNPQRVLDYLERRTHQRNDLKIPIYIRPVEYDPHAAGFVHDIAHEILAVTRDISLRGIGFSHDEPLAGSFGVVTFDAIDAGPIAVLLELRWSNYRKSSAYYLSGGRFRGIAQPLP